MAKYDFSELGNYVDSLQHHGIPGASVAVSVAGKRVFEGSYGFDDKELIHRTSASTAYDLYSMSKLYTTCAAMMLIERGAMNLDDPVAKWLPVFADVTVQTAQGPKPAQSTLTVRHLMAMQGGFDYEIGCKEIRDVVEKYGDKATTQQIIEGLAKRPLNFEPGTHMKYSLGHDVLGAVIEVVSGLKLRDFVKKNIFAPLGIGELAYHRADLWNPENVAAHYVYDNDKHTAKVTDDGNIFIFSSEYDSGGAGLTGTCDAYMRLPEVLSMNGQLPDGSWLLKPETIKLWSTNQQTAPGPKADWEGWHRVGYGYALGVRTAIDPILTYSAFGEFGWDGAAGSFALVDPVNRVALTYMQSVLNCGYAFGTVHADLRKILYKILAKA